MAATQLGLFLTETYKAEKRKERPLVLGVLLDTGKYLVVGITGSTDGKANKNMFGRAYRKAATRVGATLQYDGFDSWVVSECTHPLLRPKRARLVPIVTLQYRSLSRTRGFISGWSRSTHLGSPPVFCSVCWQEVSLFAMGIFASSREPPRLVTKEHVTNFLDNLYETCEFEPANV